MHITRYTDYSLRVLIYLSINQHRLSTINEIAQSYDISKNHLMKIVQQLNLKGYIKATRGKHGGVRINHQPSEINIGELVRQFEDKSKLVECFGSGNECVITPSCQLKQVFFKAQESFFKTLDEYTLADLLGGNNPKDLSHLLAIESA